jgi:acetyl-CoA acetyltransferase
MDSLKDRCAISGIGWTTYSRNSGRSVLSLALEASRKAIEDAGLRKEDIDGIVTYSLADSVPTNAVATCLGLTRIRYYADFNAGGNVACGVVTNAAMAVASGMANCVVVYRALNGSSSIRYAGSDFSKLLASTSIHTDAEGQFLDPYGILIPAHHFALLCRRHMVKYGTTTRQLGQVAIACRKNACLNERAMMRSPLSMPDYKKSRVIADPFRLYDCSLQSDGACAVIVTSAERARALRHRPVYIMAGAQTIGPYGRGGMWSNYFVDHAECYAKYIASDLFGMAGVTPRDVHVAEIYDCFTYSVIVQLEDFGFCRKGEGGPFVEGGRIELGGELPINTAGGLLSEAYIHGLNHVVEAVSQLRGDAGSRQVKDAEIALVTAGGAATTGSALILRK